MTKNSLPDLMFWYKFKDNDVFYSRFYIQVLYIDVKLFKRQITPLPFVSNELFKLLKLGYSDSYTNPASTCRKFRSTKLSLSFYNCIPGTARLVEKQKQVVNNISKNQI